VKALKHNGRYYDETLMSLFFDPEISRSHTAE
jgi:hypothetical protein